MAKRIEAIATYRPRINFNEMIDTPELTRYMARGTALNTGEILNVLEELHESVCFFVVQGTPVKIKGLGVFFPSMRLDGSLGVNLRMDPSIRREVNQSGPFKGTLTNAANVGLSAQELVNRWNSEHPNDPVEE
jgi:nucleoid DNA-binding protein